MQVSKEEQAEKKEQAQTLSTRSNLLDYDRKTDQGVIDEKQKEYIKANKSSFDKLVEEVRKRKMAMKKPPSLPPPLDEEEERELEEDQKSDASLSILDGHDLDNVSIRSQDDMFNTSGASSLANAVAQVTIKQGSNNKSPKPISTAKEFPKSPAVAPSAKSTNVVAINTPGGGKSKKKTGGVSQLYVTPKRKSSEELSEDCKRFRQNSITSSMLSSQKKAEQQQQPKKNSWNCPVCAKAVSVNYVNVHLDRCLRDKDSENNSSVASKAAKKKIRQKLSKKKSPKALFDNNSDDDFVDSQKIEDTDSEEEEEDEDGNPVLSKVMPPRSQRVRKAKESAKYNEDESSQVAEENDLEGIKKIPEEDDVDNIIDDFIDDFVENVDEPISATEIKKKDLNRNVEPNPASEKISTVDDDEELMEKENKEEDSDLIVLETIPPVNPDDPKGKRTVKGVGGKKSKRKDVGPDNANAGKKQPTSSSTSSSQQQQQPQPLKSSRRLKAKDLLNKDWS